MEDHMGSLSWSDYIGIALVLVVLAAVINDYRTGKFLWPRLRVIKSPRNKRHIPFG